MSGYVTVYMTASSAAEADRIASALVEDRLVACVNILGEVQSVYRWEGAVRHDTEVALVAKTRASLFDALTARVRALHAYEVPCIVSWPIDAGNPAYLSWIEAETAGTPGK
ncbi:divalent-cation tolerance protein CutA [Emcibacter sp. SYSU 3D8]|uniref:divalent-cation tolerance protein CutA n=1 Tax=Emcibacter sp. SYSU 3D8 TaxID=3133969 RepID=UPI0031FF35A3